METITVSNRYKFHLDQKFIIFSFVICAIVIISTYWMRNYANDDAYITYRHTQNLLRGNGFVFNPNEKVLGSTAPFHGIILAVISLVYPDIPKSALLLSAFSLIFICILIMDLLRKFQLLFPGFLFSILIVTNKFTYSVFPLETIFLLFLCIITVYFLHKENYTAMAIFGGIAVLTRADAIVLISVIYLYLVFVKKLTLKELLPTFALFLLILLPWFIYSRMFYGSFFPNTANTKTGWINHEWVFIKSIWSKGLRQIFPNQWLSMIAVGISLIGIVVSVKIKHLRFFLILGIWIILYTTAYTILRIYGPFFWYYFPIFVVVVFFFSIGYWYIYNVISEKVRNNFIKNFMHLSMALAIFVLISFNLIDLYNYPSTFYKNFFILGRDTAYKMGAKWLQEHPNTCKNIAIYEPGTLAFYSNRHMIDMMGLITPGIGQEMKMRSLHEVSVLWTAEHYQPECIFVLSHIQVPKNYVLIQNFPMEEVGTSFHLYIEEDLYDFSGK